MPKAGRLELRRTRIAEIVADRLHVARQTIERDYALPLTVQRLARHAHLPHLAFNRAYRDAFGIAPMDHVRQLRLQEATRQMASGQALADIAARVGYASVARFKAEFRRVFRDDEVMRARLDVALREPPTRAPPTIA